MGNTQTGETKSKGKVKGLAKIRGKWGKTEEAQFTNIETEKPQKIKTPEKIKAPEMGKEIKKTIVTDSWQKVNQGPQSLNPNQLIHISSGESSSDSVFTDPLTPVGCAAEINKCYYSEENVSFDVVVPDTIEDSFINLPLDNFNISAYELRKEGELAKKLSKLGVSKTSQISLDSDSREWFVSSNIECIRKEDLNAVGDSGFNLTSPETIIPHSSSHFSDVSTISGPPEFKRNMSVPADTSDVILEGSILKKVTSLTLALENKITKPKFVPEKLDFALYEKFEGHMLVNWYLSEFNENHQLNQLLNDQDLKLLAVQFCTHLLAAGVLHQISDKDAPINHVFKPDLMYFWAHSETPASVPQTPGRLHSIFWPPTSPGINEEITPNLNSFSSNEGSKAASPSPERTHQCKNAAKDVEIFLLEEEINRLKQEVEKYKTLIEIQTLTNNAVKDFSSPLEENKTFVCDNCDICAKRMLSGNNEILQNAQAESLARSVPVQSSTDTSSPSPVNINVSLPGNQALSSLTPEPESTLETIKSNIPSPPLENQSPPLPELSSSQEPSPPPPPPMPTPSFSLPPNCPPPPPLPNLVSPSLTTFPGVGIPPPPPPPLPDSGISSPSQLTGMGIPPPPPPPPGSGIPPPPQPPGIGMPPPPPPPPPGSGIPPPPPPPGIGIPPPPPPPGCLAPPPPPVPGSGPPPPPPPGFKKSPSEDPQPFPTPPENGWASYKANPFPNGHYLVLRKQTVTPAAPMKPLYWTRILAPDVQVLDSPTSAPVWSQIDELELQNLDEFTALFSRQVIQKKVVKKKTEAPTKIAAVKLLDSKRSQNVGILAQSLHVEFSEIENAIYNFDTSVVNLEALQQIYEARATGAELELISAHLENNPSAPLDKPEQFLYDLSKMSNFAERISCIMFQIEYEDSITNIGSVLTNIKTTCDYLTTTKSITKILSIILTLGNYMNGGNMTRGQADGYNLEILSKLKDVKSKDSQVTLLHFIVQTYLKDFDNVSLIAVPLPIPEPEDIRRSASVDFDEVSGKLQKLERNLKACENRIKKVLLASTPENLQPFKEKMETFMETAQKNLSAEKENLEECKLKFISTMKFYQFRPKKGTLETCSLSDFFDLWLQFCRDFKDIWKKEIIRIEKQKYDELKRNEYGRKKHLTIEQKPNGLKDKVQRILQSKRKSH